MNSRTLYSVTLAGYFGLLVLLVLWNGWLAPPSHIPRALVILLLAGPLLFPLRGLLHGRPYTFAWASYLALFYLAHGTSEAMVNPGERPLAMAEIVCSLSFFGGAVLFARVRGRELRRAAAGD